MREILSTKTIEVLAESRATDVSAALSTRAISHCVVRETAKGEFLGVVRVRELASAPGQRIFADLLSGVPSFRVAPKTDADDVAELFRRQNSEDAIVLSNRGTFLGLITRELVGDWTEKSRVARPRVRQMQGDPEVARLNRELVSRSARLNLALEQLDELSYAVSHEIRTPLRAIRGYAEVLRTDHSKKLDESAKAYLDRIMRASDRLDRLTLAVLAYNEIAQAPVTMNRVSVESVVGEAVAGLRNEERDAAVQILRPLHDVRADRALLLRCVVELLNNAIKFVAPGRDPMVRLGTVREGNETTFFIEDNGIGIRPEHTQRIFQLFEQVIGVDLGSGTGTGLAVVRKACDRMGATVGVNSVPGQGSRFWITLRSAR